MKVVEIFNSIDGEGTRAGELTTFIRLHGCNLNCNYCDTTYATLSQNYRVMSVPEILLQLQEARAFNNITITGGEPLIQSGIDNLINELLIRGYHVNVETNGTIFPRHLVSHSDVLVDRRVEEAFLCGQLFYTMDYKLKGSGEYDKMNMGAINSLRPWDVLKFVVSNKYDLSEALEVIEEIKSNPQIYFSPVFGKIEPEEIVRFMKDHRLENTRVQVQLHKIIWDPETKGV